MKGIAAKYGFQVENVSGEDIPPYSVVMVTGVTTTSDSQQTWSTVDQYDGSSGNIMVTGAQTIPAFFTDASNVVGNGRGTAFYDDFLYVAVDDTQDDPINGYIWGPFPGQWTLHPHGDGFTCQGFSLSDSTPKRALFRREEPPLILFLALEQFSFLASDGSKGDYDARVALCSRLHQLDHDIYGGPPMAGLSYVREDGIAIPIWASMTGGDQHACLGVGSYPKCGNRLWAKFNGQSGRWEVVSFGTANTGTGCPCEWWGYAIWKVVAGPAWELVENRCSGCYDNDTGDGPLDGIAQLRFEDIGYNAAWLTTPAADPDPSWVDTDLRYITCCNTPDVIDDHFCDLTCCYSLSLPVPKCGDADPDTNVQVVMSPNSTLDVDHPCSWKTSKSGDFAIDVCGCPCTDRPDVCVTWNGGYSASMTYNALTVSLAVSQFGDCGSFTAAEYFVARYSISPAPPDCSGNITATFVSAIGSSSGSAVGCDCDITNAYLKAIFPASLTVVKADVCDTTTTNPPTTTTPAPTTTAAPTTTPAPTTTTTPLPTTTTPAPTTTTPAPTTSTEAPTTTTTTIVPPTSTEAPTTTTTEAPTSTLSPCLEGEQCSWTWTGTTWTTVSTCSAPCHCDFPSFSGSLPGDTTLTSCIP